MKIFWGKSWIPIFLFIWGLFYSPSMLTGQNDSGNLLNQGIKLYNNKDYKGAIYFLEKVCEMNPGNRYARYYLAWSFAATRDSGKALQHINILLQQDPRNTDYLKLRDQLSGSGGGNTSTLGDPDKNIYGIQKEIVIGQEGGFSPVQEWNPTSPPPSAPAGFESLYSQIQDRDFQTRRDAVIKIGQKKDERTIPCLVWALQDRPMREKAAKALVGFGKKSVGPLIDSLRKSRDTGVTGGIIETLGMIKDPEASQAVFEFFPKTNEALLPSFEKSFRSIGKESIPILEKELANNDSKIREAVSRVLFKFGDFGAKALADFVVKSKGTQRLQAFQMLTRLRPTVLKKMIPKNVLDDIKKLGDDRVNEMVDMVINAPDVDENPEYAGWARFPVGSWARFSFDGQFLGSDESGGNGKTSYSVIHVLEKVSPDEIIIKVEAGDQAPKTRKVSPEIDPNNADINGEQYLKIKDTGKTAEVTVGEKKISCKIVETTMIQQGTFELDSKLFLSEEVPGGLVKKSVSSKVVKADEGNAHLIGRPWEKNELSLIEYSAPK